MKEILTEKEKILYLWMLDQDYKENEVQKAEEIKVDKNEMFLGFREN